MQIEFKTEGGMAYFPGLSKPVVIDSDDLPEKEAKELQRQVAEAHFFSLPTRTGELLPGAADYQTYTITVKDGKKRHTIHVAGATQDEGLRNLIAYLKAKSTQIRAAEHEHPSDHLSG
jgi:hypothetical protein